VTRERKVKVFRNGRNQVILIPLEFELSGDEAILRKDGDKLVIEPTKRKSLIALLKSWNPIPEDFEPIADSRPKPVKL
jgi:antitoxin VapB